MLVLVSAPQYPTAMPEPKGGQGLRCLGLNLGSDRAIFKLLMCDEKERERDPPGVWKVN